MRGALLLLLLVVFVLDGNSPEFSFSSENKQCFVHADVPVLSPFLRSSEEQLVLGKTFNLSYASKVAKSRRHFCF